MLVSQFLSKVKIRTSQFGLVECSPPWSGKTLPSDELVMFAILSGQCRLEIESEEAVWLNKGDLAFLPRGAAYRLGSSATAPDAWVSDLIRQRGMACYTLRHEGGGEPECDGEACSFLAAASAWDDIGRATVAAILPDIVVVRRTELPPGSGVADILKLLEREARNPREITPILANDLVNILLHEALYVRFRDGMLRDALMRGFGSAAITKALMLVHSSIVRDWTVTSLAERVGMSRSAFTMEFTRLIGTPPGQYLTDLKLQFAAQLLQESALDIGLVADRVGYASMPSFIKAFKRRFGQSPGRYRRGTSAARYLSQHA